MESGNNIISKCTICGEIPPGSEPQRPNGTIVGYETYQEWVKYWKKAGDNKNANMSSQEWLGRKELGDKWRKIYFEWKRIHDIHAECEDRFQRLRSSTIPIRYRSAGPLSPTLGNQQALAAVEERKRTNKNTQGLFLYGDIGVGKTHLMALYAKYLILYRGENLIWWDTASLFTTLKNNFGKKYFENENDSNEEIIKRAIRTDWLFLDDLGREKASDWTHEVLFHVINSRYENNRNTIVISSNYSPVQLADRIGDQIASRLIEMCGDPTKITGEDWRLKKSR